MNPHKPKSSIKTPFFFFFFVKLFLKKKVIKNDFVWVF